MAKRVNATEAMRLLRVSDKAVRKWLREGKFPNATREKIYGTLQWSIPMEDIHKMQEELGTTGTEKKIEEERERPDPPNAPDLTAILAHLTHLDQQYIALQAQLARLDRRISAIERVIAKPSKPSEP
jgi:DNA-binding transcriptional MerR regulator